MTEENQKRAIYEYTIVEFDNHKSFSDALAPYAVDGWRVLSVERIAISNTSLAYLERESL